MKKDDSIFEIARKLSSIQMSLAATTLDAYGLEVDEIIRSGIKDKQRIECILDRLLDAAFDEKVPLYAKGTKPIFNESDRGNFKLTIPLGEEATEVTGQVTPEVTPEVANMLSVMTGEMKRSEIMAKLGLKDEKHFREHYQQAGIMVGVIEMTIPEKPNSRLQKYRLTDKGKQLLTRGSHE